jgi:repressor LexA
MARGGSTKLETARLAKVADFPDGPPDDTGLTPRQHKVLEVIRNSVERRGYPPSMREIGEAVGLTSTSRVAHQLATLEKKGYLRRDPNRPRAVEVRHADRAERDAETRARPPSSDSQAPFDETDSGNERPAAAYVPLVGRIAAGGLIQRPKRFSDHRRIGGVPERR